MNDTWRSVDGGATWTPMNRSSGWTARTGSTAVTLPDGSIILMGGQESVEYRNDVWRSDDNGATWMNITPSDGNPWSARAWHASVAMLDGSILLIGGDDGSNRMNDVWWSDDNGVTWAQLPDAGWTGRAYHTSVVMPDGGILMMGGVDTTGPRNDVWRSDDGGWTWMQLPDAGWLNRQNPTAVALPDGSVIVMGGWVGSVSLNDTWRLQPAGSTEQNPSHTYTTPGTYTVTLQASNAAGYSAARMTGYITVTAAPTPTPTSRPPSGGGGGGGSTGGPDGYNVGGNSAVSKVTVTGTGLNMLIVTGRVQSSPGADIPPVPGTPYQYVELTPARFEEITGANITFTIPAAWLAEHGLSPGRIVLYRYNGTVWEGLPTVVTDTAGTTVTFMATSPGFSLFAISSVEQADPVTTPTAMTTPTTTETATQAAADPTAEQTTAVPAGDTMPDFPLPTIAIVTGAVLVLAAGGYLVRRWWIRRQNPALFKDYD